MNFVEELTWRGMVHTMMPGTEELLAKEQVTAYLGIDPVSYTHLDVYKRQTLITSQGG